MELDKKLTLTDLILIGVGNIIGSGIFILFATILASAKKYTFWAFVLAAIPNIITALAYAELASIYKSNDMEYDSIKDAFGKTAASIAIYILLGFIVFNTATVLLFAGQIMNIKNMKFYICLLVLLILSFINYLGITVSKSITNTIGIVEITVLIMIGLFSMSKWKSDHITTMPPLLQNPISQNTFWFASFMSLFLYSGYDTVVKLSEETIDDKNIPLGVIGSVMLACLIYILLSLAASSSINMKKIYNSTNPITHIFEEYINKNNGYLVTILGVIIVLNTFFISIISLSRFSYSLSKEDQLPTILQVVNDNFHTPHNAIIAVFVVIAVILMLLSGEKSAAFANIFFLVFSMILMIAVVVLRFKKPDVKRTFMIPVSIYNIPILPVIGVLISLFYLFIGILHFHAI